MNEISLGLSSGDVSYLRNYEDTDLASTSLDNIDAVQNSCLDQSNDLPTQFADLKIPDISKSSNLSHQNELEQNNLVGVLDVLGIDVMSKAVELSHPNEVVQNNIVQMVDMPTIDENFTRGLQVVGTIHVPFSSVNTTTLSYATSSSSMAISTTDSPVNDEVRNNSHALFSAVEKKKSTHEDIAVPLQLATKTTESPSVFVVAMTIEQEKRETDPVFKLPPPVTMLHKKEEVASDPLDTTLHGFPEPQRASTPNVNDEHLTMMNETIEAGSLKTVSNEVIMSYEKDLLANKENKYEDKEKEDLNEKNEDKKKKQDKNYNEVKTKNYPDERRRKFQNENAASRED